MKHRISCQTAMALGALAGLFVAAPASAITPPGTPPTFYCDANRPANADTVENQLNTLAKNSSPTDPDRGNQPRWERVTTSFAGVTPGPDPLPSSMSWAFFTGHEIDRYTVNFPHPHPYSSYPGIYVGSYPSSTLPANHLYYLRYRFKLDASVNPATYKLQLPAGAVRADDHVRGIYLNGKRIHASLPSGAITLGGGTTADEQWKAGENELAFAVYDTGGGAIWLGVQSATQSQCDRISTPAATATPVPTLEGWSLGLLGGLLGGAAAWRRRKKRA